MAETYFLRVTVAGSEVIDARLARVATAIGDFSPLWGKIRQWFVRMEVSQFGSEGHGLWRALAESTVANRTRKHFGGKHPILEMTGRLAASLAGGSGFYEKRTHTSIELGTTRMVHGWNLGMLHEMGTSRMPRRPPIGRGMVSGGISLFQQDKVELRSLFASYIHRLITAAK